MFDLIWNFRFVRHWSDFESSARILNHFSFIRLEVCFWLRLIELTDGGRETLPFLQFDFCHLDYEDDLESLRNSNIT